MAELEHQPATTTLKECLTKKRIQLTSLDYQNQIHQALKQYSLRSDQVTWSNRRKPFLFWDRRGLIKALVTLTNIRRSSWQAVESKRFPFVGMFRLLVVEVPLQFTARENVRDRITRRSASAYQMAWISWKHFRENAHALYEMHHWL